MANHRSKQTLILRCPDANITLKIIDSGEVGLSLTIKALEKLRTKASKKDKLCKYNLSNSSDSTTTTVFFGLINIGSNSILKRFGNASIDSCGYSPSLLQYALRIKYYCLYLF